jgi:hypothetical protein
MEQFVQTIVTFPVVPFTVLLGVVLCYWLFVILGVASFGHGHEGVAAGAKAAGEAVSGALKGVGEAAHGAVKGVGEAVAGSAKAVGQKPNVESDGGLLSALGLGKIPITITGSSVVFFAWLATIFGTPFLGASTLGGSALIAGALVLGLLASAIALRPLKRVFDGNAAASRSDLRGKICVISSGKVEKGFGTATLEDGGAGLMLHVTCAKENTLKKGERALIIDYDAAKDSYELEPIDWLLPQELEQLKDPATAGHVLDSRLRQR